jgi:hypothetical protein
MIALLFSISQIYPLYRYSSLSNESRRLSYSEILNYIAQTTKEEDYVLLWGAEAAINFRSHRTSPTKYVYQYPLQRAGYTSPQMDIIHRRPKTIIDATGKGIYSNNFEAGSIMIDEYFKWIKKHYRIDRKFEINGLENKWTAYIYKE